MKVPHGHWIGWNSKMSNKTISAIITVVIMTITTAKNTSNKYTTYLVILYMQDLGETSGIFVASTASKPIPKEAEH